MSPFQEMAAADRAGAFLDLDVFGEEREVEGRTITVVMDYVDLTERDGARALSRSSIRLFGRTEDLPKRKMAGDALRVDGVGYSVESWREDMGISEIVLALPESW
mgnify:CR=1 FL=1